MLYVLISCGFSHLSFDMTQNKIMNATTVIWQINVFKIKMFESKINTSSSQWTRNIAGRKVEEGLLRTNQITDYGEQ